jgi:hypothetical protein
MEIDEMASFSSEEAMVSRFRVWTPQLRLPGGDRGDDASRVNYHVGLIFFKYKYLE